MEKGEQIGLENGVIIGQILLLEKLLGRGQTAVKDFDGYGIERLQEKRREIGVEYKKE